MNKHYVRVVCNISCKWEGLAPSYRLYINDQLFAERTWIWPDNCYIKEEIQIEAEPGRYVIDYELLEPNLAELYITKPVVLYGPGTIDTDGRLRIHNEIE